MKVATTFADYCTITICCYSGIGHNALSWHCWYQWPYLLLHFTLVAMIFNPIYLKVPFGFY